MCLGLAWLSHYRSDWQHSVAAMYILLALGATSATLGRPARAALMPNSCLPTFPKRRRMERHHF